MLDSSLLRDYIDTFIGYGDYQAKYWLVGMEEGGGGSLEEINKRFASWERHGRQELSDLMPHHIDSDLTHFVSSSGKLQTTWSQLIRVVLAIQGKSTNNEDVRAYQQSQLGRFGGDTCLLELMPLPSPNAGMWLYRQHSLLPQLRSRNEYVKHYARLRALRLRQRIEEHRPAVVVFYSLSYMGWWNTVAGVDLTPTLIGGVKSFMGQNQHTVFAVVPQPSAHIKGKGNNYYTQVGQTIAERLLSQMPKEITERR